MWWVSVILAAIIVILIFVIIYSGGDIFESRDLNKRIQELEQENENLKETNETLRASYESSSESSVQVIQKVNRMAEKLVRVKEALRGSKKSERKLKEEFDSEIGPGLVKEIFGAGDTINYELKRRLADRIFVGDIGIDILRGLSEGRALNDVTVDAGVPLRVGREKAKVLEKTGYLDGRLNVTSKGMEVLGRD